MAGKDLDDEAGIRVPSLISPFKSKDFNKFFFGIVVAAIVLAVLFLLVSAVLPKRHSQHSLADPSGALRQLVQAA